MGSDWKRELTGGRPGPWGLPTYEVKEARLLTGLPSKCLVIQESHSTWSPTSHQDPRITVVSSEFLWRRRDQIAQVLTIMLPFSPSCPTLDKNLRLS